MDFFSFQIHSEQLVFFIVQHRQSKKKIYQINQNLFSPFIRWCFGEMFRFSQFIPIETSLSIRLPRSIWCRYHFFFSLLVFCFDFQSSQLESFRSDQTLVLKEFEMITSKRCTKFNRVTLFYHLQVTSDLIRLFSFQSKIDHRIIE